VLEHRLAARAVAALENFQRIVSALATQMVESEGSSPPVTEGSHDRTIESTSPVSDLVKAAILETGYENALKAENNDEAEARLENLQELVNAAVDYDEMGAAGLRDFIDHSALVSDTDQRASRGEQTGWPHVDGREALSRRLGSCGSSG
jgi:superfamily I DNA/RNA helicase